MTREDIIRMAREAGMVHDESDDSFFSPSNLGVDVHIRELKAFEALVAAAEREACAQVVWEMKGQCWAYDHDTIAAAIRARGGNT